MGEAILTGGSASGSVIIERGVTVSSWNTLSSDVYDNGILIVDHSIFGYYADISISGVTDSYVPYVVFPTTVVSTGEVASVCKASSDVVTIYSSSNSNLSIATIVCVKV